MKTLALTLLALAAFASNSILCRLALRPGHIDPVGYTWIRLVSGTAALALITMLRRDRPTAHRWDTPSAICLVAYAFCFSIAYVQMSVGTGALVLFSCVQFTMVAGSMKAGGHPAPVQWLGLAMALVGLLGLVAPGLDAPPLVAALLMGSAGCAWGIYSLRGKLSKDATQSTYQNFLVATVLGLIVGAGFSSSFHANSQGVALAIVSGAISSGLGYVAWYAALKGLTAFRAASVQLAVPVVASLGAAMLGEPITIRLAGWGTVILAGIAAAVFGKRQVQPLESASS